MAHKKGVGSSKNGRESESKRLGVKIFGGQAAIAGNIILRQRGNTHHPGENVYQGKDHTLHAKVDGLVKFTKKKDNRSYVSIEAFEAQWIFLLKIKTLSNIERVFIFKQYPSSSIENWHSYFDKHLVLVYNQNKAHH